MGLVIGLEAAVSITARFHEKGKNLMVEWAFQVVYILMPAFRFRRFRDDLAWVTFDGFGFVTLSDPSIGN